MSLKQRFITKGIRQFGHPRGLTGHLVGHFMAHRGSNRRRSLWVVDLLEPRPTEQVLEIGFGPGIAIRELAGRAGHVYGIDHSREMVRQARRRAKAGNVTLAHTSVADLPALEPLDAIMSVNSLGFWPDPDQRLVELRTLLRPGGRIAIASQPRCPGATAETTAKAGKEIQDRLIKAGFTQPRVEILPLDPPVACVLAVNDDR